MSKITVQELVEIFCQQDTIARELIYVNNIDSFCEYQSSTGHFKVLSPLDMERKIYLFLTQNFQKNLSVAMTRDFIGQIRYKIYRVMEDLNSPYIALRDHKMLDLTTFEVKEINLSEPCFYYLNCDSSLITGYNGTPPKIWQDFLDYVIVDENLAPDKQMQMLVQEMFGYYLLDTLEAHATFFLVGGGMNGKSVLFNVLRELIGKDFCEAMSIEKLTTNQFAAANLIGKKINICSEEESSYIKSDKFKAMVSGDPISVERKYGNSFMWIPTVKHAFATNEIPSFSGLNHGLLRRLKFIKFNRRITELEKDTKLTAKLIGEIAGIMAWAMEGARRLVQNEFRFTECDQSAKLLEIFKENISAAILFFNETFVVGGESDMVSCQEMYDEYKVWAEMKGKKKQSYYVFIKDLKLAAESETILNSSNQECLRARRKHFNQINF